MTSAPKRLVVAVWVVASVAAALSILAVRLVSVQIDGDTVLLSVSLSALVALARLMPVHLAPKLKTTVATVPLFAAALLIAAPLALLVAALGAVVGDLIRRAPWFQIVFDAAEATIRVSAGTAAFVAVAAAESTAMPGSVRWATAAIAAAVVLYIVNSGLVELIVAIQMRYFSLRAFLQRRRYDVIPEAMLFLIGACLVGIGSYAPWLVAPIASTVILLRWSFLADQPLRVAGRTPETRPAGADINRTGDRWVRYE